MKLEARVGYVADDASTLHLNVMFYLHRPLVVNLLTAVAHPYASNKRVQQAYAVQTATNMVYFNLDVVQKSKWDCFFVVATVLPSIRKYAIDNGLGDLYPMTQPLTVTGHNKFSLGPIVLMNAVGCSELNQAPLSPEEKQKLDQVNGSIAALFTWLTIIYRLKMRLS